MSLTRLTDKIMALILMGCASTAVVPPADGENPVPRTLLPENEQKQLESDVRYVQSREFDQIVQNTLPQSRLAEIHEGCAKSYQTHAFCYAIRRPKALKRSVRRTRPVPSHYKAKTPRTVEVSVKDKVIGNWESLRKLEVSGAIHSLKGKSQNDLTAIAGWALRESRCPNNGAIATAALLEDFLPKTDLKTIADLFEKGARCEKRASEDREQILTRAALWNVSLGNLKKAEKLLLNIKPTDYFSGRVRFWLWRVQKTLGKQGSAQATLGRLISKHPYSFHAMLAELLANKDPATRLLRKSKELPTRSRFSNLNKLIVMAEQLNEFGFKQAASVLVDWGLLKYPSTKRLVKVYLSTLGTPNDQVERIPPLLMYYPSLANASTMKALYPQAYFSTFEKYRSAVDPYLMLAIARKESRFDPLAKSPANAEGIMQLNPVTAKKISGSDEDLFRIERNISISARYLSFLMREFSGNLPQVISSYNAGEHKVEEWKARYTMISDPVLFVDLIPYRETRTYVSFVLNNYFWYKRVYENDKDDFLHRLFQQRVGIAIKE